MEAAIARHRRHRHFQCDSCDNTWHESATWQAHYVSLSRLLQASSYLESLHGRAPWKPSSVPREKKKKKGLREWGKVTKNNNNNSNNKQHNSHPQWYTQHHTLHIPHLKLSAPSPLLPSQCSCNSARLWLPETNKHNEKTKQKQPFFPDWKKKKTMWLFTGKHISLCCLHVNFMPRLKCHTKWRSDWILLLPAATMSCPC